MPTPDAPIGQENGTDRGVDRRAVLKGLGTGAIASVGLVGSASAHEVVGEPVFCGCSQLCVCVTGNADVLMARETDDGYDIGFVVGDDELDPYPQGEPRYSGNFCVDTADADVPDGKIIGLQVAGNRWVNPNSCAQDALAAEQEQLASTHPRPVGASGSSCGSPPCETDDGVGADAGDEKLDVDWEDCQTVHIEGRANDIDRVVCHYIQCFPRGPCPTAESVSMEYEPPLTLDGRHLPNETAPFQLVVIELKGDSMNDIIRVPNPMDCSF